MRESNTSLCGSKGGVSHHWYLKITVHFKNSKTTNYIFFFSLRSNERSPHICLRGQEGSNGKNTESKNEALFMPCYNIMHYGMTWQQFVRTLFKNTIILFHSEMLRNEALFSNFLWAIRGTTKIIMVFLTKDFWTFSQNHRWNGGDCLTVKLKAPLSPHYCNSYVALIDCPGLIGSNCKSLKVFKVYKTVVHPRSNNKGNWVPST